MVGVRVGLLVADAEGVKVLVEVFVNVGVKVLPGGGVLVRVGVGVPVEVSDGVKVDGIARAEVGVAVREMVDVPVAVGESVGMGETVNRKPQKEGWSAGPAVQADSIDIITRQKRNL